MTVERAAKYLDERLRKHPWYISVGLGSGPKGDTIFVYVRSPKHKELTALREGWLGYPVIVRAVGSVRASVSSSVKQSKFGHKVARSQCL
jgi:hypothetical protein